MAEYIHNQDFETLIKEYKKNPEDEDVKKEVTYCFYLLAENIIRAFRFTLIDREDALQEAVLACLSKMHRFDPDRGKAFNWFTTIILNHYRQLYRTCKNDINLKKRYLEKKLGEAQALFEGASSDVAEDVRNRIRRGYESYTESEF